MTTRHRRTRTAYRATLLLVGPLLGACTTTIPVTSTPTGPLAIEIAQRGESQRSRIETRSSSRSAERLSVDASGLDVRLIDGSAERVPYSDVRTIQFRDGGQGALDGALIGLGVALGLGVLGAIDPGDGFLVDSRGEAFGFVALLTGIVTVPAGALIGAIRGHRTVYVFPPG